MNIVPQKRWNVSNTFDKCVRFYRMYSIKKPLFMSVSFFVAKEYLVSPTEGRGKKTKEFQVSSPLTGEGEDEGESLDTTCHGMSLH